MVGDCGLGLERAKDQLQVVSCKL